MTEIYAEIAKLSDKFRTMAYGLYSTNAIFSANESKGII